MKKLIFSCILISLITTLYSQIPITIGTTTYDLQTYSSNNNHLITYTDGKVSASWMFSDGFGAGFTDLGTNFNHFNGTSWGVAPTSRLESQKVYSSDMIKVVDHEVVLADDVAKVRIYENSSIGGTTWTQTGGTNQHNGWFPMSFCPSGTQIVYVVGMKSTSEDLIFSRSDDGGETWAILNYNLPNTTEAWGCDLVLPACYQVVAKGNDVYVLYGSLVSDLILMHSGDKGATWDASPTVLIDFPIDNYAAAAGETTDFDGDGDYDWIDTNDGAHEMLITNDGTVHVFSGRMQIRDVAGVTGFYYDYTKGGIYHWKTGDAAATLHEEFVLDWDGDGDAFSGISDDYNAYTYESFTCMPSASFETATGRIYLSYMMPVEDEISASGQNYYDLFGSYSDDDGDTWSAPINLTYTAHEGKENAFPSASPLITGGKFHITWQEDDEPGTSQDLAPYDDDIQTNYIKYVAWEETRFEPYNPTVDFTFTLVDIGATFNATFTNLSYDAESYDWDFGDFTSSTLENPTHIYSPGIYEVCLTATNVYGSTTECQTIIAVNEPVADFTYFDEPDVTFVDLSTGDPDTWFWDFDDGFTSTEADPVHTFLANGDYNVCLTVSNLAGESTHCENVNIDSYLAPTAYFIYSGAPAPIITFTDLSLGLPTSWFWDFDDGFTSTLQNPVHTFLTNGTYNVCLTATNAIGSSTTCSDITISTYTPPTALFSHIDDPVVTFTDLSSDDPSAWDWDFGDGSFSSLQNPVHTYTANGIYEACLTASNASGDDTYCEDIIITGYLAPEALFDFDGDNTVTFTDLSTNDPTSYSWDFDDGSFSSVPNPVHTFTTNGTYNVCLSVSGPGGDDTGCQDVVITNGGAVPVCAFDVIFNGTLTVVFSDLSTNSPTSWIWEFGDESISGLQNPSHTYPTEADYTVCLTATNATGSCTTCEVISVSVGVEDNLINAINVYPNPAQNFITIESDQLISAPIIQLFNSIGQKINCNYDITKNSLLIHLNNLPSGNYYVKIIDDEKESIAKFIVERN